MERRFIESCYAPHELHTASPGRRFAGYFLDSMLIAFGFGVGWLIWFAFSAREGRTPGKQLLGMYVIRNDASRAGGSYTWYREVVIKSVLFGGVFAVLGLFTDGYGQILWVVPAAWLLFSPDNRCGWDFVSFSYVGHAPTGFRPLTAAERESSGDAPLAAGGIPAR